MEDCVFCSIARGLIPSVKLWEDQDFIALLDIYPNTTGQALVIPRKHVGSYIFDQELEEIGKIMMAAKKVSKILEKGLGVRRVNLVFEGLEINHLHAKLYPVHGLMAKFESIHSSETIFFGDYPGYVSTLHGPKADPEELRKVALQITG